MPDLPTESPADDSSMKFCPTCGVDWDEWCITPSGRRASKIHAERLLIETRKAFRAEQLPTESPVEISPGAWMTFASDEVAASEGATKLVPACMINETSWNWWHSLAPTVNGQGADKSTACGHHHPTSSSALDCSRLRDTT